jgi:serine/threonine protein kinase
MRLNIPLSCACSSPRQTAAGFPYLVTYLVDWYDTIESIAQAFDTDAQSVFQANRLSSENLIFPFTPVLVPVRSTPTYRENVNSSSPELTPPSVIIEGDRRSPHHTWIFVGAGIAAAVAVLIFLLLVYFFIKRRRLSRKEVYCPKTEEEGIIIKDEKMQSVSSEGVRYAVGWLTVYKLEELQEATGNFSEANLIKGSVYKGSLNGDKAAIKIMKGDVSAEINILKQINHSNIIRLSGFCVHQDNTYLVYEYAERDSLAGSLIHNQNQKTKIPVLLNWQQRVQIAYDIADALNYLHNYSDPPYIHMNLTSSNIVLDSSFRAKIANFGQARTSNSDNINEQLKLQLTKHVVGTHGYMAPEYVENGLITSKIDVFAFGVVMLELLSGRKAVSNVIKNVAEGDKDEANKNNEVLLCFEINAVLEGENVREKLSEFIDPALKVHEYPLDLVYSLSVLAKRCVARDLKLRPPIADVLTALSKILSSSLDWDPSDESEYSISRSFET